MKIFFAGNTAFIAREEQMANLYDKRLLSYHYVDEVAHWILNHKRERERKNDATEGK